MSGHISEQDIAGLHQPIKGASGKGCLTRCNGQGRGRDEGNLCSHIWQAYEKAKKNPSMYNYPAYRSLCGQGNFLSGSRISKKGNLFPGNYSLMKKEPQPGEWDIGVGRNFQHFLYPWWHNAHHIIPNRTLTKAIRDASASDDRLFNLIRGGLLMGEYNLNDKENMVILPMGKNVAASIGLPRHLIGHEARIGDKKEYFNHPNYNKNVRLKLRDVMNDYKKMANESLNDDKHPGPPKKLSADKLEDISIKIFCEILDQGKLLQVETLDDMIF